MAYLTRQQALDIINKAPANLNKEVLLKELGKTNTIEGYNEPVKQESGFLKNVARDIVKPFAQGAELLTSGAKAYGNVLKAGGQLLTGNKEAAKQTLLQTEQQAKNRQPVNVLGENVGNITTGKQAAGAVLNIASNFVGGAGTGSLVKQGFKQGVKTLAKEGLKVGATSGALYGAGDALSNNKNVLEGALTGGITGGVLGGALGGATGVATGGIVKAGEKLFNVADTKLYNTAKELLKMSPTASKKESAWGKDTARFIVSEPVINPANGKETSILNLIKSQGKYLDNTEALNVLSQKASEENQAFESILKDSGVKISIDDWGRMAKKQASEDLANRGSDLQKAITKIDEEINAYKQNALQQGLGEQIGNEVFMDADKFNMLKRGAWEKSSVSRRVPGSELDADLFYQMGHAAKDLIEQKIDDAEIGSLNKRLGDIAQATKVLESANGKVVPGGFFGKQATKLAGTVVGSGSGFIGSIIGNLTGGALADVINSPEFKTGTWTKLYKMLDKTPKGRTLIEEAKRIAEQRGKERASRLLLEAPKSIRLGSKSDTSGILSQEEAKQLLDLLKIKEPQKLLKGAGENPILMPSKTKTSKELIQNKQVKPGLTIEDVSPKAKGEILKSTPLKTGDYLYHGTNEDVLDNIIKEGLKPGMRGQLSFSKTEDYAKSFARDGITPTGKTSGIMLRIKTGALNGKTTLKRADGKTRPMSDQLNEILTKETVSPESLEILKNGKWIPLTDYKKLPLKSNPLIQEAKKTPKTVNVYVKSKFSEGGGYKDVPVIRKVDNVTLYQGSNAGDKRQFWTDSKKYASQFGEVKEKTGSFYQVDNGNRVTNVYVEVK